jgi:cyclopropane fatty-acyl-phospholipid synthase-like methyltransferase
MHAGERYAVEEASVTLSKEQAAIADERIAAAGLTGPR